MKVSCWGCYFDLWIDVRLYLFSMDIKYAKLNFSNTQESAHLYCLGIILKKIKNSRFF